MAQYRCLNCGAVLKTPAKKGSDYICEACESSFTEKMLTDHQIRLTKQTGGYIRQSRQIREEENLSDTEKKLIQMLESDMDSGHLENLDGPMTRLRELMGNKPYVEAMYLRFLILKQRITDATELRERWEKVLKNSGGRRQKEIVGKIYQEISNRQKKAARLVETTLNQVNADRFVRLSECLLLTFKSEGYLLPGIPAESRREQTRLLTDIIAGFLRMGRTCKKAPLYLYEMFYRLLRFISAGEEKSGFIKGFFRITMGWGETVPDDDTMYLLLAAMQNDIQLKLTAQELGQGNCEWNENKAKLLKEWIKADRNTESRLRNGLYAARRRLQREQQAEKIAEAAAKYECLLRELGIYQNKDYCFAGKYIAGVLSPKQRLLWQQIGATNPEISTRFQTACQAWQNNQHNLALYKGRAAELEQAMQPYKEELDVLNKRLNGFNAQESELVRNRSAFMRESRLEELEDNIKETKSAIEEINKIFLPLQASLTELVAKIDRINAGGSVRQF